MELTKAASTEGFVAIHFTRHDYADRRLMLLHDANLNRRCVGTQQCLFADEKSILHVTSWMIRREVERFKIVVVVFDLGTVCDAEAHRHEYRRDLIDCFRDRVHRAPEFAPTGQCQIEFNGLCSGRTQGGKLLIVQDVDMGS